MDSNSPLSFVEWKHRFSLSGEQNLQTTYTKYLIDWFNKARENSITVSQQFLTKQKYLYLLSQLQTFFSDEEKNVWYQKINLSDEKELLLSIPYFAKKLKSIALYYLELRQKIKKAKISYNLVGSTQGLENIINNYLLEVISLSKEQFSPNSYNTLPNFTEVKDSVKTEIEELYDGTVYFDRSPTVPLSSYFDTLNEPTSEFFKTKGLMLSSDEWIFNSFFSPVTSSLTSFVEGITSVIFEKTDAALFQSIVEKYLGDTKIFTEYTSLTSTTISNEIQISSGNNFFYYPYGFAELPIKTEDIMLPVPLSSTFLLNATYGRTPQTSDIMHVKTGSEVKSAWLQYREFDESELTMEAQLKQNGTTSFLYPYPGYGVSAEDVPWTGRSLSSTPEFQFLSKPYKSETLKVYWSEMLPNVVVDTVLLNNTNLSRSGSTPSKTPDESDIVYVSDFAPPSTSASLQKNKAAWLYEFNKTSIPLFTNNFPLSCIFWPYQIVTSTFPEHLKNLSATNVCNPISVHNLNLTAPIAGSTVSNSEKIYKLNHFNDSIANAAECCWLSGSYESNDRYRWAAQKGFSASFPAGRATRFIWTGMDLTPLSAVFSSTHHSENCTFSSFQLSALRYEQCNCKQVYYSPFGHAGKVFVDNNSSSDFIIEDISVDAEPFDLASWRDEENKNIYETSRFAWYQTSSKTSWGYGKWIGNYNNLPLKLRTGKCYYYYRSKSRTDASSSSAPYIINYNHSDNGPGKTKWIQAKKNKDNSWVSTDQEAITELFPGDLIKWERPSTTKFDLISTIFVENESKNTGSIWSTHDIIALSSLQDTTLIAWPIGADATTQENYQYPTTIFTEVSSILYWKIEDVKRNKTYIVKSLPVITFTPPATGVYRISVVATKLNGQMVTVTNIPAITAIDQYREEAVYVELQQPVSHTLLEQPLSGWNYTTSSLDYFSEGAAPYWAELSIDASSTSGLQGLYTWGYSNEYVGNYIPNSIPKISNLSIRYGNVIDYKRKGQLFTWREPISFKTFVGKPEWCKLIQKDATISTLSSIYSIKLNENPTIQATNEPSDIILTNYLNGNAVEVYYYALNTFVWNITSEIFSESQTTQLTSVLFESQQPWNVLSNKHFPTIATLPTLEKIYSAKDVGGFFTPNYLGATQAVNKNFVTNTYFTTVCATGINSKQQVTGRGFTKQQQSNSTWQEDNRWIKEPITANQLTGSVKKQLTKTLQTFTPYQENDETKSLGLITPKSRISPWGGPLEEDWTDSKNQPKSFAGVLNVNAWTETQILKQRGNQMDCWVGDVFGNQYGLFKSPDESNTPLTRIETTGDLWVKTNSDLVLQANNALSAIYTSIKNFSPTLHNQLTGGGISNFDCFYDTLMFQTSSALVFARIDYDYDTEQVTSTFDNIRFVFTDTQSAKIGQTWFSSATNTIDCLTVSLSSNQINLKVYTLNLTTFDLNNSLPNNIEDTKTMTDKLSGIEMKSVTSVLLSFNKNLKKYLITLFGTTPQDMPIIVDLILNKYPCYTISDINAFEGKPLPEAPIVISSFDAAIIPSEVSSLQLSAVLNETKTFQLSALNNPTNLEVLTFRDQVTASGPLTLKTKFTTNGLKQVGYKISNQHGENIYCLTVNVILTSVN